MSARKRDTGGLGFGKRDAYMKRQVMSRKIVVAITNGILDFGT